MVDRRIKYAPLVTTRSPTLTPSEHLHHSVIANPEFHRPSQKRLAASLHEDHGTPRVIDDRRLRHHGSLTHRREEQAQEYGLVDRQTMVPVVGLVGHRHRSGFRIHQPSDCYQPLGWTNLAGTWHFDFGPGEVA